MALKDRLINCGLEILWFSVLLLGVYCILDKISSQYVRIGDPDSVAKFQNGLIIMLVFLWILTLAWWTMLNIQTESLAFLRQSAEQYSFVWSIVFVFLATAVSILLYFRNHIIYYADFQQGYSLTCIFVLPLLFTALMYAFPPRQIARVIVPGVHYKITRTLISALAFAAAFGLFTANFIT